MEIIKKGFTKEEFTAYLEKEVKAKMKAWKPIGVTLHNTWAPTLANWPGVVKGKKISVEQRLENTKAGYVAKGWRAGPHLFVDPDKIWAFTPLWERGLHSPSYNSTHWGLELAGNFDVEQLPDSQRENALHAIRELYRVILGYKASATTFRFHGEDPRTTHKACPGKNVGTKERWLADINVADKKPEPAPPVPEQPKPVLAQPAVINDATLELVKRWEAFRAEAYQDGARKAIGYGRNEGHRGFVITPGMVVTEKQAADWLRDDLTEIAEKLVPALKVKATPNQIGALCSLGYNVGPANMLASSALRLLNEGKVADAAQAFLKWNKARDATGQLVERKGLTRRREAERDLFLR